MKTREHQDIVNMTGAAIAVGLVVVLACVTWALVYRAVPEANQNALLILIGILSTNITQIVNWYYGSSSTQKKQQETIDKLATRTAAEDPTTPGGSATATAKQGGIEIAADTPTHPRSTP